MLGAAGEEIEILGYEDNEDKSWVGGVDIRFGRCGKDD